ncbi:hypothetical protein NM208_g8239 [Fusarium decemcellulare]|uniref:Uncharacterized protein n=1 Tax=Fusarium decemcellulare TaxID=57161 RepID=A0ACC1S699_9HYPO|nr:hypothetical protein NM208_g8239 [Fusarium decemcellulare]
MSFGFSVGDFIAVSKLVIEVRKRFVDAPSQLDNISNELRGFSIVMADLDILLSECELAPEQQANLKSIIDDSHTLLTDLQGKVDQYRDVRASSTSPIRRVKIAWARLKLEPDEIQEVRNQISSKISHLNALIGQLTSQICARVQRDVQCLIERSNKQERHEIYQWISTVDHGSQQRRFFGERFAETGQWLLSSDKFQKWLNTKGEVLFCPGLPGAGKTTLTSVVIDHLLESKEEAGIAYHYCDFRLQDQEHAYQILSSILKQLARCLDSMPESLMSLFDKHKKHDTRPKFDEISSTVQSVASLHQRVFIMIDGLDECPTPGDSREVMEQLFRLQELNGANIFATSRFIPDTTNQFEGSSILEIRASKDDVRKYLNLIKDIKGALKSLPAGSSAYGEIYENIMERIERQCPDQGELAKDVLGWITLAKRPITVAELREAIAVEDGESKLDPDNFIDIDDMVSDCAGLVTVDQQSGTVSLIHYTTQEYLERTRARWFPDAPAKIATSCINYLLFPVFDVEFREVEWQRPWDSEGFAFFNYAKKYGVLHACLAIPESNLVGRFFSSSSRMPGNCLLMQTKNRGAQEEEATAHWLLERGVNIHTRDEERRTPLHYATMNGWRQCVEVLLRRGAKLTGDVENMTPFHYTVGDNAEDMAQTFLDSGIPVDTPVKRVIWVPSSHQDRMLFDLMDDVQISEGKACAGEGLTALHLATLKGNLRMARFFLHNGANPNFASDHGETPLHLTLRRDLHGAEWPENVDFWNHPDSRIEVSLGLAGWDDEGEREYCSISAWIEDERSTTVSLLLERPEIDVNAQDIFGTSPLHVASRDTEYSKSMIQKLLKKGAIISSGNTKGETPLHLACREGNMDSVTTLLAHGASPMDVDVSGLNALHHAAHSGCWEKIEEVLKHVPVVLFEPFLKSKDKHGRHVLHHLLGSTCNFMVDTAILGYFLARSVCINDLDDAGMSPVAIYLRSVTLGGYADDPNLLRLMFESGADPSFETRDGLGLVHLVSRSGRISLSVLELLASWGVNLGAEDRQGRTALHHCAINGTLTDDVLHFLCHMVGLSNELRDIEGRTPLEYAVDMYQKDHDLWVNHAR